MGLWIESQMFYMGDPSLGFLPLCATPKITVGGRSDARIAGRKAPGVCRVTFDDVGSITFFMRGTGAGPVAGKKCRCKRRKAFHHLVPELSLMVRGGAGFSVCELVGHKRAWQPSILQPVVSNSRNQASCSAYSSNVSSNHLLCVDTFFGSISVP